MNGMNDRLVQSLQFYEPRPLGKQRLYAVFLPLIYRDHQWQILYEVRAEGISQPGEVAFPGGAVEPGECPSDAAIRETMEELCISRDKIEILGELDYFVNDVTIIYCFVGRLKNIALEDIHALTSEVQECFTLPLEWLCCHPPTYYATDHQPLYDDDFPIGRLPDGKGYPWRRRRQVVAFYDIPKDGHNLWGLTARFTDRFIRYLKDDDIYECIECLEDDPDA